ncbi:MAG: DUF2341 domain-containing protein [Candidatus Hodarchaeota archaeon]
MRKAFLALSLVALIFLSVLPPIVVPAATSNGANWLPGWSFRKGHGIISTHSHVGTNYQAKIVVHYGLGTDIGADVFCNNKCRTDFGDIRFTDTDGMTELDYWMEEKMDSNYAIFWVELTANLIYNSTVIYLYYGRSDAVTSSNGEDVFIFFDDFETGTVDYSKWDVYGVGPQDTVSIVTDPTDDSNKVLKIHESGDGNSTGVLTNEWEATPTVAIGLRWRRSADYDKWAAYMSGQIFKANNEILFRECVYFDGNYHHYFYNGPYHTDYQPAFSTTANTWHKLEYRVHSDYVNAYYDDEDHIGGYDLSIARGWARRFSPLQFEEYEENRDTFIDSIYVRKYVADSLHGAWGGEESPSSPSSEWPMFKNEPSRTGYSNTTGPERPSVIWRYYQGGGFHTSSPAVVNNKVYVGSWDNSVICLDGLTGTLIWTFMTNDIVVSSPAVVDERVYVGSKDDFIYCLDGNNGSQIWKYQTGGSVYSSPAVVDERVYVGSNDGYIYCLNASNGSLLWRYQTGNHVGCSPAFSEGRVFVGSWDQYLYCLDATNGSLIWKSYAGHIQFSSPGIADNRVYVGSKSWYNGTEYNYVSCFNSSDGSLIWRFSSDGAVGSPAAAYGRVYIGSLNSSIYCLNASTGGLIWNYHTIYPIGISSPAVADSKLYIGSYNGHIYCLNAIDGSLIWIHPTYEWQLFSPAVVDGKLYIGSYSTNGLHYGYVYCIGEGSPWVDEEPPYIMRVDYSPEFPNYTDAVVVNSELWDISGLSSALLYYEAGSGWASINMFPVGGTTYKVTIPAQITETQVDFYLEAIDNNGNVARSSTFTYMVADFSGNGTDFILDATSTLKVMLRVTSSGPILVGISGASMPVVSPTPPSQFIDLGSVFSIAANISSGFTITIDYFYTDEQLDRLGISESTLAIFYWDASQTSWNQLQTTVDSANNVLETQVNHLTIFAVFGRSSVFDDTDGFRFDDSDWPLTIVGIAVVLIFVLIGLSLGVSRARDSRIRPVTVPEVLPTYEEGPIPETSAPEETEPETVEDEMEEPLTASEPVCSYCGHINPVDSEFCIKCGRHLGEAYT